MDNCTFYKDGYTMLDINNPPPVQQQATRQEQPLTLPGPSTTEQPPASNSPNNNDFIMDPIKQRATAQIAVTAGLGTAAYFLWNVNRTAAIIFAVGTAIVGYTVVAPHEREDGTVRPSALTALQAKAA